MRLFAISLCALLITIQPAFSAAKKSADYCKKNSDVEFVDTAFSVTDAFLKEMDEVGVKIVGRYYDYPEETLPKKRLRAEELELLENYGMSLVVVFQHRNNKSSTFVNWKTRGPRDATESLKLAREFKQPPGSAINFGVDGDFVGKSTNKLKFYSDEVLAYFQEVQRVFREENVEYKIGVYGSGATCAMLSKAGITSYCWLSHSHGFYGTPAILAANKFDLEQYLPGECGGRSVDFGKIRSGVSGIGEFPAKKIP
jgi:hypothetical protein